MPPKRPATSRPTSGVKLRRTEKIGEEDTITVPSRPRSNRRGSRTRDGEPALLSFPPLAMPASPPSPIALGRSDAEHLSPMTKTFNQRMASSATQPGVVYLVRHGMSEWNVLKKWQGTVDTKLSPEGFNQARGRALGFAAEGIRFDRCSTSDLSRASKTAELLMATLGSAGSVRPDVRLRECSLGQFEGQTKEAIYGEKYSRLWSHLSGLTHENRLRTPYFDGLETPLDVGSRAGAALVDLALECPAGGTALAVTHSTVIESLLASLFGADFDSVESANLSWLRFEVKPFRSSLSGEPLEWRLVLTGSDGITFSPSPDAIVHDAEACRRLGGLAPGLVRAEALHSGPKSGWLVATMATALVVSIAGISKILVSGGNFGASPGQRRGSPALFWGPVTASVDWCEDNYAVTPFVSEFVNSVSSLTLVAAGGWAAAQVLRAGAEARYQALGWILVLVGAGSLAYHATLRKTEQALDEISMLLLAVCADYCVLQGDCAPNMFIDHKVPLPSPALGVKAPFGPALGVALCAWACIVSGIQWTTDPSLQPLAFHLSFVSAEVTLAPACSVRFLFFSVLPTFKILNGTFLLAGRQLFFIYGAWKQYRRSRDPRLQAVFRRVM